MGGPSCPYKLVLKIFFADRLLSHSLTMVNYMEKLVLERENYLMVENDEDLEILLYLHPYTFYIFYPEHMKKIL